LILDFFYRLVSGPDGFTPVDMAISPEGKVIITDDENYSFYYVKNDVVELLNPKALNNYSGKCKKKEHLSKKVPYILN